jgi:erythronate-4-phosphate dehydrogenase
MKIVVDENIIFAEDAYNEFGSIHLLNGRSITNEVLKDADALIVRSITKVDKSLLQNTKIKFIGTSTIGTDHIDVDYLLKNKIAFADAKGCNADSVSEYVFTALLNIAANEKINLSQKTIGIVGVGNIGGKVVRLAKALGMNLLKNDPPKEREGIGGGYVKLNEVFNADVITMHVPLNKEGKDKTVHLLNEENLKKIKEGTIIINTSRGQVIDNNALLKESKTKRFKIVLDVWENEPNINVELLNKTKIGTAHIAGYSLEGKTKGTKIVYDALCKHLNKKPVWEASPKNIRNDALSLPRGESVEEIFYKLISSIYDIELDDKKLRGINHLEEKKRKEHFDNLRKEYPVRREFSNYTVTLQNEDLKFKSILEAFRFKVKK